MGDIYMGLEEVSIYDSNYSFSSLSHSSFIESENESFTEQSVPSHFDEIQRKVYNIINSMTLVESEYVTVSEGNNGSESLAF